MRRFVWIPAAILASALALAAGPAVGRAAGPARARHYDGLLRVVGDGPDYIGTALNLTDGRGVSMTLGEAGALQRRFAALGEPLASTDIENATLRNQRGQREFGHFWFYSAMAAPFVWLSELAGFSPLAGFAAVNILLYIVAWRLVAGRASWQIQVLLLVSPLVWWLDKAHTEVFTVAALTIAAALFTTHPWWSAVAAAAASTQNPPLAVLALAAIAVSLMRKPPVWRDRVVVCALCIALALVALHPAYYLVRFGTLSPLAGFSTGRPPTLEEFGLVLWDPVMGIAANWPGLVVAIVVALIVAPPRARLWPFLVTLVFVLFAFSQTQNPVHGGTPAMSRYALWLGPLMLPILLDADRVRTRAWRATLTVVAVASAAISVVAFHPSRVELSHRPTIAASWLWRQHPSWNNPLPPVFVDSLDLYGGRLLPLAEPNCRKILLIGRDTDDGMWPVPCAPVPVPDRCRERGALCYANARANGYSFVPMPRIWWSDYSYAASRAWPRRAEPGVAQALVAAGWWQASPVGSPSESSFIQGVSGATVVAWFESARGAVLVLRVPPSGGGIELRSSAVRPSLVDGRTGARLPEIPFSNSYLALPGDIDFVVVTLLLR